MVAGAFSVYVHLPFLQWSLPASWTRHLALTARCVTTSTSSFTPVSGAAGNGTEDTNVVVVRLLGETERGVSVVVVYLLCSTERGMTVVVYLLSLIHI